MVEVHAAPRVAIRSSVKSAQSIVVVCFLLLILYILFSGGRASKSLEKVSKNIGETFSSRRKPSSTSPRTHKRGTITPDSKESADSEADTAHPLRDDEDVEGRKHHTQKNPRDEDRKEQRKATDSKPHQHTPSQSDTTTISTSDTSASPTEQDNRRDERRKKRKQEEAKKKEREETRKRRENAKAKKDTAASADSSASSGTEDEATKTKSEEERLMKKKEKEKKAKREKEKKIQEIGYEKPGSTPELTPLPDHRSATPTRSIYRAREADDRLPPSPNTSSGSHISWSDEEGKSPHPVTKHFRKWNDYVGLTEDSNAPFKNKPAKVEPKWQTYKKLPVDPAERCVKALRRRGVLGDELLKLMEEAEGVAMAKPREKLWVQALSDQWDDHHGSIPAVAVMMAQELSKHVKLNDIKLLEVALEKRKSAKKATTPQFDAEIDLKRDYAKFKDKVGVGADSPLFVFKFILSWYCEHYRCRCFDERMGISEEPVPMMSDSELGKMAQILGWMEYLGRLNMGQRLFIGLDLYGLSMRVQAMREGDGHRLDLTVFMPGGPAEKKESDPMKEWAIKLEESGKAFRTIHTELASMFYQTEDDMMLKDPFVRRRLIFRPGWSVRGVRSDKLGKPEPERSVAQRTLIKRPPEVLVIPANISERITRALRKPGRYTRKALSRLSPGEVCYQSIRQYAWDKSTVTPENSKLNPITFWIAWSFSGEKLQESRGPDDVHQDQRSHNFVRSIDLGGYIPLFRSQPPRFVSISGFPALEVLVLSYVPLGKMGATAELLLNKDFGLLNELKKIKEPTHHVEKQATRLRLFISIADSRSSRSIVEDLNKKLVEEGRKHLVSGGSQEQAIVIMRDLARDALGEAFLVDETRAGDAQEGLLPKGIPLRYDTGGAEKLLGIGREDRQQEQRPSVVKPEQAMLSQSHTAATPESPPPPPNREEETFHPPRRPPPPPPARVNLPPITSERGGPNPGSSSKNVIPQPANPVPPGRSAGSAAEARRRAQEAEREAQPSPVDRRVNGERAYDRNDIQSSGYRSPTVEDDPEEGGEEDVPKDKKSLFGRLRDIESKFRGGGGGK
ncbi:hypothetical protein IAR50_004653 [Cryptococcus sp. DSM 104548]